MANLGLGIGVGRSAPIGITSPYPEQAYSLGFDGSTAFVNCNNGPSLAIGTSDMSYSCWIKTTDAGKYIIAKRSVANGNKSLYLDGSGKMQLLSGTAQAGTSNSVINDGNWHHIVMVYDNAWFDGVYYYLDGIPDGNHINVPTANYADYWPLYFCTRMSDTNFLDCLLDEVAMFDRKLTALEVEGIYNHGNPTDLTGWSGLVGYWTFNDGTTANDTSGNSNHGVIFNATHQTDIP